MDGVVEDGMDPDVGLLEAGGVGEGCWLGGHAGHHIPASAPRAGPAQPGPLTDIIATMVHNKLYYTCKYLD